MSASDFDQHQSAESDHGTLYLTVEDFLRNSLAVRQKAADAKAIQPAEWESVYVMLAEAALVKSIIGLDGARANGEDIEVRLDQFILPVDAFVQLVLYEIFLPVMHPCWRPSGRRSMPF